MGKRKLIQLASGTFEEKEGGYIQITFNDYPLINLEEVKKREQACWRSVITNRCPF